jgi:flagellar assembly protein FliH
MRVCRDTKLAKAVFRSGEVSHNSERIVLDAPFHVEAAEVEETAPEADEIFEGPTAAELRDEADEFKRQWENEKEAMMSSARAEAELVINDAKLRVDEKIKTAEEAAQAKLAAAEGASEKIKSDAAAAAASQTAAAESEIIALKEAARKEGFEAGRTQGYESGKAEVQRLIIRTQLILSKIQDKRADIMSEAEQQIIDLALLISRKVVKSIAETNRNVVIENIKEALAKVKTQGNITVKVNLADLELSTAHLQEFTNMMEAGGNIQILEDSSVDSGGCVVETDFGEIDARIANQFAELESKILSVSPIRNKQE